MFLALICRRFLC